ncbi:MAG: exo-alpha-sialidase, partial [Thermoplasmatales archaeon]|nr:exo-alpha-sialidase [Thermoplasmatales archaeon]
MKIRNCKTASIALFILMLLTINVIAEFRTDVRVNDDTGDEGQMIGPEKTAVVMKDNVVYAVWQDFRNVSDNLRPDIYFAKGTIDDMGNVTFSTNVMVNDIAHSPLNDKPSAPAMAVGEDGIIYVVWTDMRNIDNQLEGVDVYFSRSTDGGTSFETNQLIGSTTGGSGAASIAVAGSHVYIVYEHCCDPANNVLDFVISSDNGQSFGDLETIYIPKEGETGTGQPTIAAMGNTVYIAFLLKTTDYAGQVALITSSDNGASFSDPKIINDDEGSNYQAAISLALSGDNVYLVWHDLREPAGVYFSASHDKGSTFGSNQIIVETGSSFPVPAVSAYGENVAITYCGRSEGIYGFVVLAKISQDAGATWSNESIVSDTDVSRSAIGPSAVSVGEKGVGILWVDGRGSWEG